MINKTKTRKRTTRKERQTKGEPRRVAKGERGGYGKKCMLAT